MLIRKLREFQIGQVIRHEGPESHRPKAGTPTMGGLLILAASIIPTLLWADLTNAYIWIAVLSTLAFGAIGFADDYLKITRRNHHGLLPRYKSGGQIVVALLVGVTLHRPGQQGPLQHPADLPVLQGPDPGSRAAATCRSPCSCSSASSNAVNLTDGLDGLAISCFAVAAATFTALAYVTGHRVLAEYLLLVRFAPAGGADGLLRRPGRRQPRLPLVQLVPGRDLHGRRRIARARRRARHRGAS